MEITEVRIKLTDDSDDRLQAFCSITFDDCFVVRDLKIIEGTNGPFVAMPSRKLTSHCGRCRCKNHLRAAYCNQCGAKLNPDRAARDQEGRAKLYADIAHPVNSKCREMIQDKVIAAFQKEVELSQEPGYVSKYDDTYEDEFTSADFADHPRVAREAESAAESPAAAIQRTDAPAPGPEASHLPPPAPTETPHESSAGEAGGPPPRHMRPKPGFGAGIFEQE